MRLAGTYAVVAAVLVMAGALVYAYVTSSRDIPEVIFGALLALVGTLVGYIWHRTGDPTETPKRGG